jgi:hypothetical protein
MVKVRRSTPELHHGSWFCLAHRSNLKSITKAALIQTTKILIGELFLRVCLRWCGRITQSRIRNPPVKFRCASGTRTVRKTKASIKTAEASPIPNSHDLLPAVKTKDPKNGS